MNKKIVFIRDDDVYKADDCFRRFFEFCLNKEIPVVYGVIPQKITQDLAKLLNKYKKKCPHLIDIVQHGWRHKNYNCKDIQNKYEFGLGRSYEQQRRDIFKGYQSMKKAFKENFTPAFVPPYHGYDGNTLRIVRELGFPIFSAGRTDNLKETGFINFQARVALNKYGKTGMPLALDVRVLIKKVMSQMFSEERLCGMVFHHRSITTAKKLADIKKIFMSIKEMAQERRARIILFSDFIKSREQRSALKDKGVIH